MEKIIEKVPEDRVKLYDVIDDCFPDKKVCMFDIETTGLSPLNSFTYIIGVNIKVEGEWNIIQLFNDDGKSEPEIIRAFQEIIKDYEILVEFNGDRFDIPYIEKRMNIIEQKFHISMTNHFKDIVSFDLMKCIKPYKFALGLPNIKQKTIEKYLGIDRVDTYTGGELINVYLSYLTTHNSRHREMVLRHNRDDMEGMIFLSAVLSINSLTKGDYNIQNIETALKPGTDRLMLRFSLENSLSVISEIDTGAYGCSLSVKGQRTILNVPISINTYRYYYSDREKDGFLEKNGFYVPSHGTKLSLLPAYKESARSKEYFYLLGDDFLGRKEVVNEYISAIITQILEYKGR